MIIHIYYESTAVSSAALPLYSTPGQDLAFTRYCYYHYGMSCIAIKAVRGGNTVLRNSVEGGECGAPQKGVFANNSIDSCIKA